MSRESKSDIRQRSSTFSAPETGHGRQFFHGWREGSGLGMIQVHYMCCAIYFYYYYIVICSEKIKQLTVMQSQWEP